MKNLTLFALVLLLACNSATSQTIYYVNNSTGSNSNPGTSWALPFRDITKALASAQGSSAAEVQIWVAAGSYTPIDGITALPADHRDTSFAIYRGTGIGKVLKMYGGFIGTETSISSRDTLHTTYMEGAYSGGAVYHVGVVAGMAATADSLVIDGFTIRHGQGDSAGTKTFNGAAIARVYGAGLALVNNLSGKIAIRNCKITDNGITSHTGQAYGAGAYFSNSPATIDSSRFANNVASDYYAISGACDISGGAIYAATSHLAISGCQFDNNQSYMQRFSDKYATGGAVYFNNCTDPVVINCAFRGNQCTNNDNGLFLAGGAIVNARSNTHVAHCLFSTNQCYDHYYGSFTVTTFASAIFNRASTVTIDTCNFINNADDHVLGGLFGYGGTVYDSFSTVTYTLDSFTSNLCRGGYGGAVSCEKSTDHINNNYFYNNLGTDGGCIAIFNHGACWIDNCNFEYTTAGSGGHLYNSANSILHIANSRLYGGTAGGTGSCGGSIYSDGPQLYVSKCHFENNQCTENGGAIYCKATPSLIDSCVFFGNRANYGGGIFTDSNASLKPLRCTFQYNRATYVGGGICFTGPGISGTGVLKCDANVFANNTGEQYGGGVGAFNKYLYTFRGFDTLTNNIFANNECSGSASSTAGGAIYAPGSTHFISNNTFAANAAPQGGAIASDGTLVYMGIYNNIFFQGFATSIWSTTTRDTFTRGTGIYYSYNNIYTGTGPQLADSTNFAGADGIWKTADDGLALTSCSPAVNTGNNDYVMATELSDVLGTTRIMAGRVDIGAYEAAVIGNITGPDSICKGSSVSYTDTSAGGIWFSADATVATVGSTTGLVTAVAAGITVISYTRTGVCSTPDVAIRTVAVVVPPSVVSGIGSLCAPTTITLTDSVDGGTWSSSSPAIGSINATTGVVTGISAGIVTFSYNLTNACGVYHMLKTVTVNAAPAMPVVSGAADVCIGSSITLTSSSSGGTWSTVTGNAGVAGTGVVTGVSAGIDTVKYTFTNSCGSTSAVHLVTVHGVSYCDSISAVCNIGTTGINIYPNPAHNTITIDFSSGSTERATLSLTNIAGEKVREWNISGSRVFLGLNDLPEGVYILYVQKGREQYYRHISIR